MAADDDDDGMETGNDLLGRGRLTRAERRRRRFEADDEAEMKNAVADDPGGDGLAPDDGP